MNRDETLGDESGNVTKINLKGNDMFQRAVGYMITQMPKLDNFAQVSVKEGIKQHGDKADETMIKEFSQLSDKNYFKPISVNMLNKQDKDDALNLITMIKQKRCGKIKGRVCVDGRKKQTEVHQKGRCGFTNHTVK